MLPETVTINASAPIAAFDAERALGVAIDGGAHRESRPLLLKRNHEALRAVDAASASYRLRTELAIEAWHWTSHGHWSEAAHRQGYWTGDPSILDTAKVSHGYRLPRRGDTYDEANNDGYSRIDDGRAQSFWKSNPYLDAHYTGASGEHRDWVVVEFAKQTRIDTARIWWGEPYAREYRFQYWVGDDEYNGHWVDFPCGEISDGAGGTTELRLAARPVRARFVRLLLERSSHTSPAGSADPRDAMGYALSELALGFTAADGRFHDLIRHAPNNKRQTVMHVSSTDPWHRASDRDLDTEQPSPIALARSGLVRRSDMIMPVGILYDTPENAEAAIDYLGRWGTPPSRVELGEEPDGQLVSAEDYAALFVEFARRLHRNGRHLQLGGPSLVNGTSDKWLDPSPDQSWTSEFLKQLAGWHASNELAFFSFEYFPFDDMCGSARRKLLDETALMRDLYARLASDGVPREIPWIISEYGFSAFAGRSMLDVSSALLNADLVADFLSHGGSEAYLYGFAPNVPIAGESRCAGAGNMMLWLSDRHGGARWAMPTFYGQSLLGQWASNKGLDSLFAAQTDRMSGASPLVRAYPLRRPDGSWAVLIINRATVPMRLSIRFVGDQPQPGRAITGLEYSARQYRWSRSAHRPTRDLGPKAMRVANWSQPVRVEPLSLTLLLEQ